MVKQTWWRIGGTLLVVAAVTLAVVEHDQLGAFGEGDKTPRASDASPSPSPSAPAVRPRPHPLSAVQRIARRAHSGRGHLIRGSDPSVLPGPVLIADKLNNRLLVVDPHGHVIWRFPRRHDLVHGQTFRIPDDAFFTPDGRGIIATQEDDYVITRIDVATHRITWRYGRPGLPGSGRNRLYNPDDAMMLPNHRVVAGDIKNCRLIAFHAGQHTLSWSAGQPGHCWHQPPMAYGSPNGMFPVGRGRFLVTEITNDWVDLVDRSGHVFWATHPPGVSYPSDTNKYGKDRYLTVDYSSPGQIVIFDRHGKVHWRYAPRGRQRLDKPSLALPLPNGDILANDDANHRVIVVDPHTHRIVWQYGHTGVAGRHPGYLDNPDGVDLLPPHSYADTQM